MKIYFNFFFFLIKKMSGGKVPDIGEMTFGKINLDLEPEALGLKEEEKGLISKKRKRKEGKKLPLQLFSKKQRSKVELSVFQKILDELMKRPTITKEIVDEVAEKQRVKLDEDNKKFFMEIGNARASIKKYGLPGDICKNKFHVFEAIDFYSSCNVVTDDRIVWTCFYSLYISQQFNKDIYKFSEIEDFSVVSDKVFSFDLMKSGYIQDYYADSAIINDTDVDPLKLNQLQTILADKNQSLIMENLAFPNGQKYNFYEKNELILAGKSNLAQLLEETKTMKFFNSKNKLALGLKDIKMKEKIGSYLNIIENKLTDFSPACLFVKPPMKNIRMFVRGHLNTNSIYDMMKSMMAKLSQTLEIPLPSNAVFWDNINSFIQLIAMFNFIEKPRSGIGKVITIIVNKYQNSKEAFTAWKKIYKDFESIATHFYDIISTKLTIDNVTRLETKCTVFISNYIYMKNQERGLDDVRFVIGNIPRVGLMQNFINTNVPYELVTMIARLIVILKTGKADQKNINVASLFRTIGFLCSKVFFGGDYACIPKVRSFAAFLGNARGELDNETFTNNIAYLVDSFRNNLKKEADSAEKKMFDGVKGAKKINDLFDLILRNSEKKMNDSFFTENFERLKEKIKSDKTLYDSLLDDVNGFLLNDEEDDIKNYADFLSNDLFNSFIKSARELWNTIAVATNNPRVNDVIASLNVANDAVKTPTDVSFATLDKVKLTDLPVAPVVEVNLTKLKSAFQNYKEGLNEEAFVKKLDDDLNTVVKRTKY